MYDCMIFLQAAARQDSPAALCLLLAEKGIVELCVSAAILAEIREVLNRPRLRAKFSRLTGDFVYRFLNTVEGFSTLVAEVGTELVLTRDKKDEPYLNLAHAAGAEYLVSRDSDLLDIPYSVDPDSLRIREMCPALQFTDPVRFIRSIQQRFGK